MLKRSEFEQLLWRCGLVTVIGSRVTIDYQASCEELSCSLRTLKRWLTGQPCPRAVSLLKLKARAIPESWKGWHFDRQERLVNPEWPHGKSSKDLMRFAEFYKRMSNAERQSELLSEHIDTLQDKRARIEARARLGQVINQLSGLMDDPVFFMPGEASQAFVRTNSANLS